MTNGDHFDDDLEYSDDDNCPDEKSESETGSESDECISETDINIEDVSMNFDDLKLDEQPGESDEQLLKRVHLMLSKTRNLVKLTRSSNNILKYLRKKQIESKINFQLMKDFKIRWNFTYLFLMRLLKYKDIIIEMSSKTHSIPGITTSITNNIKKLSLKDEEWTLILAMTEVLSPFYEATKMLSGRTYQTLSISYLIMNGLNHFLDYVDLEDEDPDLDDEYKNLKTSEYYTMCNQFKSIVSKSFCKYVSKHISEEQADSTLVSLILL